MNFGQVLTAMVTPFDQNGELDLVATKGLVNYLIANGSNGLVIAGTTGESPTLSHEEKLQLFRFVVQEVNGRVPVIAGTGSNNTKASIELTKEAEAIGVDAIMLVTPYYNKPSQEGLYQHFQTIAESTTLPIMLYNIPGRSVINMEPETIIRLSQMENIVSIKEASGDLDRVTEIISKTPNDFSLYSGEDSQTLPTLAVGGTGIVSVASHVIGNEMQEMVHCFRKGDVANAAAIHQYIFPMMKALFAAPSPTPVKEALNRIGVPVGSVRLPLIPLNDAEKASLERVITQYETKKEVVGY
ncbi:4-hydroxy-tetrahydrodipicolinate synthase [Terrihalobacillus insolitus]|uniref:4-hydroxy-tetrahydrodipicolinate synthase n=1 Tax=Terrihalobacillus insolitus TaxID=2950438 RepID=UPI0023413966|nr:4-hydroxy-tetrahydrodipicolinate synthase [Terrihalobacillus insolitus]MDC3414008.1 4-hydroxy-tetrahydrodipicolinate synthase [Terrihalobacillus insolitus]